MEIDLIKNIQSIVIQEYDTEWQQESILNLWLKSEFSELILIQ